MSYMRMDQLNEMFGTTWRPCMRARLHHGKRRERREPMWLWRLRFNRKSSENSGA